MQMLTIMKTTFTTSNKYDMYHMWRRKCILLDMFDSIWNRGISIRSFSAYRIPDHADYREQHLELLDQIKQGPMVEAENAMVAHIREGLHNHVRWLHDERH